MVSHLINQTLMISNLCLSLFYGHSVTLLRSQLHVCKHRLTFCNTIHIAWSQKNYATLTLLIKLFISWFGFMWCFKECTSILFTYLYAYFFWCNLIQVKNVSFFTSYCDGCSWISIEYSRSRDMSYRQKIHRKKALQYWCYYISTLL